MSVVLCPKCSTRNASTAELCRRCGASLGGGLDIDTLKSAPQSTLKGIPMAESLLGGKWLIEDAIEREAGLFLARDIQSGEQVTIKRLDENTARDRVQRSRFLQEANLLLSLKHPNVLRAIDVIEDGARPSIIFQHHPRKAASLEMLLEHHGRLPLAIAVNFLRQLLSALEHIHEAGVLHRRLSPAAILVREEGDAGAPSMFLTDFGLAHVRAKKTGASKRSGTLMGMRAGDALSQVEPSPYMAPEMLSLESTRRTDLYSLAVIFFEMCTGSLPVAAESKHPETISRQILNQPPTALRQLLPHASRELESLLESMLQKSANARPQDAREVLEALSVCPEHDAEEMVLIPRGSFQQGSSKSDPQARKEEQPARTVSLDAYSIDRFPVTVAQFKRFLDHTHYDMPEEWGSFNDPVNHPNRPVVFVSWEDAEAYASWVGKRLPTEAEWEKAARGEHGRIYPWGDNAPDEQLAWFGGKAHPAEVDAHPKGASGYGVHDLAGNAFEWVNDWYERRYYRSAPSNNPKGPDSGKKRVLKGGSFAHPDFALRCAVRGRYIPGERRANHSFRCAWSLRQ